MSIIEDQVYYSSRFVDDLEKCLTREEIVELRRKLDSLRSYDEEAQPCEFTNYVIGCIFWRHYEVTDKI